MIANCKTFLLATATAVLMPALANATVVTFNNVLIADQTYTFANVISPGDNLEYRFTVLEDLFIADFSVSATATDGEDDIRNILFGIIEPLTGMFTSVQSIGTVAAGLGFVDGMSFEVGDIFSFFFEDGITNDVGVTLSFETRAPSPVPLPATALLMLPVLMAGGVAGWRRRKTASAAV